MSKNINIKNTGFSPQELVIIQNTPVTWTNTDSTEHAVTNDDIFIINTGNIDPTKTSQPIVFSNLGVFDYYDEFNRLLRGRIIVRKRF